MNWILSDFVWLFNKNYFTELLKDPTDMQGLLLELDVLSNVEWKTTRRIDLYKTEFALNEIVLSTAKNETQQFLKTKENYFINMFERLKTILSKDYLYFPANEKTRLECIMEMLAQYGGFAFSASQYVDARKRCIAILRLNDREISYFDTVYALYKCKYFVAVYKTDKIQSRSFAKTLFPSYDCINGDYSRNLNYSKRIYENGNLKSSVDCLGNSVLKLSLQEVFSSGCKMKVYSAGRNVYDCFTYSKFGKTSCCYKAENKRLTVTKQYFLSEQGEVRNISLRCNGIRGSFKTYLSSVIGRRNASCTFFKQEDVNCFAVKRKEGYLFCASVPLQDGKLIETEFTYQIDNGECRFSHGLSANLKQNQSHSFSYVNVVAESMVEFTEKLKKVTSFGGCLCNTLRENKVSPKAYAQRLQQYECSNLLDINQHSRQSNYSFTRQFGSGSTSLLLAENGASSVLLDGFVFGVRGADVYFVSQFGRTVSLLSGNPTTRKDGIIYSVDCGNSFCSYEITAEDEISLSLSSQQKGSFLFVSKFDLPSSVALCKNKFYVKNDTQSYSVEIRGELADYTTNVFECNSEQIRTKLSKDLISGQGLILLIKGDCELIIQNEVAQPQKSEPYFRESLLSTFLNYINEKNSFLLRQYLKKADALTLCAINYTNPNFVKNYIEKTFTYNYINTFQTVYYNENGKREQYFDKLLLPLSAIYYSTFTGDKEIWTLSFVSFCKKVLFDEEVSGVALCIKALALKKYAKLFQEDKTLVLSEYRKTVEQFCSDSALYKYAQAVGAVEMLSPSKQRLKDLANEVKLPKCWYYVSQLENLYGLNLFSGCLSFTPQVQSTHPLEQLCVCYNGKRADVTFSQGDKGAYLVDGVTTFQGVNLLKTRKKETKLSVLY